VGVAATGGWTRIQISFGDVPDIESRVRAIHHQAIDLWTYGSPFLDPIFLGKRIGTTSACEVRGTAKPGSGLLVSGTN